MLNQSSDTLFPKDLPQSYQQRASRLTGCHISPLSIGLKEVEDLINSFEQGQLRIADQVRDNFIDVVCGRAKQVKKSSDLDWYSYLNNNHTQPIDRENMAKIIAGVHELIRKKNYSYLNTITTKVINDESSVEAIICVLRSTFTSRNHIKGWNSLLQNANTWISRRGLKASEILSGLTA